MDSQLLLGFTLALGVISVALIILLLMEREKSKSQTQDSLELARSSSRKEVPFSTSRTVTSSESSEAKSRLRLLDIEREILSYAIRRLYEASAKGKITETERENLSLKYEMDLRRIKEEIARGESVVALNDLERMQEEFVRLFSERFGEINKRIEDLRLVAGLRGIQREELGRKERYSRENIPQKKEEYQENVGEKVREEPEEDTDEKEDDRKTTPSVSKKKTGNRRVEPKSDNGDAETKVEQIVAEVEKVLDRLGQMEVEE